MGSARVSLLLCTTQLPQHSRCHVKQIAFQSTSIHSVYPSTIKQATCLNHSTVKYVLKDDKVSLIIILLDLCNLMHHRDSLSQL